MNIRRVAYGVKELADLKKQLPQQAPDMAAEQAPSESFKIDKETFSEETIAAITKAVLARFGL